MIDNRGFEIIGYILQQLPPDIFTKEIIANLFLIANSISENGNNYNTL